MIAWMSDLSSVSRTMRRWTTNSLVQDRADARERSSQPQEERRPVVRKQNVDVDQFVGGARQNSGYGQPLRRGNHLAPGFIGGATALVQDAVDGGGTDPSLGRNLDKPCRPLPTPPCGHRLPPLARIPYQLTINRQKAKCGAIPFSPRRSITAQPKTAVRAMSKRAPHPAVTLKGGN